MAYTVKCRKCGSTLNRDKAFRVVVGKVNTYYCNESEYNNVVLENNNITITLFS